MVRRTETIYISLNAKEVAEEFCAMDSVGQAEFFNEIAKYVSFWDKNFCFQMQYVTEEECLSVEGRNIMKTIGEYSNGN